VRVHNLQITAACGRLKALFVSTQSDVFVNLVCIEFRMFKDIFSTTIAVAQSAERECLSASAFTMCSLPVMAFAASLSSASKIRSA
jgi:hypothetical protein